MPNQVYYNGDWYYTYEETLAGESPATNPEKWVFLPIPAEFVDAIEPKAAAEILKGQQRVEQAMVEAAEGRRMLDDLKTKEVFRSRRTRTLRVPNRD